MNEIDRKEQEFIQAREAQEAQLRQEQADLREVLSTAAGRRFISRVFKKGHLFEETFTGNSQTYHKLGKQSLARWLYQEIEAIDPSYLWQMQADKLGDESKLGRRLRTILLELRGD